MKTMETPLEPPLTPLCCLIHIKQTNQNLNCGKYRLHTEPEVCNILALRPQFDCCYEKMQVDK